jgi:ketosteroid isomerase-like protein
MTPPARSIFEDFYGCLNAQDIDGAMALIADEAVLANPSGTFTGKVQIRSFLQRLADTGHAFEFADVREAEGRLQMAYRIYREGKLVEAGADGLTIVQDGRIVFDGTEQSAAAQA